MYKTILSAATALTLTACGTPDPSLPLEHNAAELLQAAGSGALESGRMIPGEAGKDGAPGEDGAPGVDGTDGANGAPGVDGATGQDGSDGANGANGANGAIGSDGTAGVDGADGVEGAAGIDGESGTDGADGENGADGQDASAGSNTDCVGDNGNAKYTYQVVSYPSGDKLVMCSYIGQAVIHYLQASHPDNDSSLCSVQATSTSVWIFRTLTDNQDIRIELVRFYPSTNQTVETIPITGCTTL